MWRYFAKRLLWLIFVILGAAFLIFTILYFIPGDPAVVILGEQVAMAEREALRESLGLNDPYIVRLGRFFYETFIKFDFGTSYMSRQPVLKEILARLPRTLILGWGSMIIHTVIGLPLGVMAALHHNKWQDNVCVFLSLVCASMPSFWLALMLVVVFSVKLGWLPALGSGGPEFYVLPLISNSMQGMALTVRQTRSSMLENIRADFVTTAKAKGVSSNRIVWRHIIPNALIPIITILGTEISASIAGSVVIENVFSFPGLGLYLTTGINTRDYPVVQSCVVLLAAFAAIMQVLVDLVYALVDPRIKAQYSGKGRSASK